MDGYNSGGVKNVFEVYDASTNTWSKIQLNYNFSDRGGVVADNKLFFSGSNFISPMNGVNYVSCKVWKFQF